MFTVCVCFVLCCVHSGICSELIVRSEQTYKVCVCVCVCVSLCVYVCVCMCVCVFVHAFA
jgi:hypothetical protein